MPPPFRIINRVSSGPMALSACSSGNQSCGTVKSPNPGDSAASRRSRAREDKATHRPCRCEGDVGALLKATAGERRSSGRTTSVRILIHKIGLLRSPEVLYVGLDIRVETPAPVCSELRYCYRSQYTDDRYDHQQLDKGKTPFGP